MMRKTVDSPLGPLTIVEEDGEITRLEWKATGSDSSPLLDAAARQLTEYFGGTRQAFDLPLRIDGGFQGRFLRLLAAIPFGETRTYGQMARELEVTPQAVGQACGANRIPIFLPCHRVLAQCGLGGFSAPGGIETKVALLRHESAAGLLI